MTEQLPIINTSHNVTATKGESSSLLGRGLTAIQRKETGVVSSDLDSRYRQARDIYNRITDYGREDRFKVELLPTQEELLNEPLLQQLQPFYNSMKELVDVCAVFQELANQGYGKAYLPLVNIYWGGQGVSQDIEKSCGYSCLSSDWLLANQSLNDPEIWRYLGWKYQCGILGFDVNQADEKAAFWYRKAAEQDDAESQYKLGELYQDGEGVEQDIEKAVFWYLKTARQGHAQAQKQVGLLYHEKMKLEKAVEWYQKAAEQGHVDAQLTLGRMYEHAQGVQKDLEQAVFWYLEAAKQGDASAQKQLGWMYETGNGVLQDDSQAKFWYLQAAQSELLQFINRGRANQEMNYCLSEINSCDICGGSLKGQRFVIDGMVGQKNSSGAWAYMCATCFASHGAGIGWGKGQLYERTPDNEWLQVAGFEPLDE